jgi:hypothetical protein
MANKVKEIDCLDKLAEVLECLSLIMAAMR